MARKKSKKNSDSDQITEPEPTNDTKVQNSTNNDNSEASIAVNNDNVNMEQETESVQMSVSRCSESLEIFLEAVAAHQDKNNDFDFEDSLRAATAEELSTLWTSLNNYLNADSNITEDIIEAVVMLGKITVELETITQDTCPAALITAVTFLHQKLPNFTNVKLVNNVCYVLEAWYVKDLPDKDNVILNVVIWLLRKALGPSGAKTDTKRLWNVHQTLLEHRLSDNNSLEKLLVATVGSNMFLTTPHGVKWLVFLFSLSPDLVTRLHKQTRASLVSLNKAACLGLGEVYHKSWLSSGGDFKSKLELDCIQDLMYRGVMASRGKDSVAINVARVLSYFHQEERSQPTRNMLARLYEPILWRNLKVANHVVRLNACELFLANYPVEDQEQSRGERESSLEMQHNFILKLIRDEHPKVRAEAVKGTCRVLADYWSIIPSDTINTIISIMLKELVWDSSQPRVRAMTLAGVSIILSTPQSHVYMKAVLPKLAECLHDSNEGVRVAFLEMLLTVKGIIISYQLSYRW